MSDIGLSNLGYKRPPFFKALLAYCFNLTLLFLSLRSLDFLSFENVHVVFFLIPLYYWVIHQPSVMPLWFIFLSGLLIDFFVGGLLGLHAFLFVVCYIVLYRVRRILLSQPFLYQAVLYVFLAVCFEVLQWALMCLLTFHLWEFWGTLVTIVGNIVVYGPIVLVLKLLHRIMSGYGRRF